MIETARPRAAGVKIHDRFGRRRELYAVFSQSIISTLNQQPGGFVDPDENIFRPERYPVSFSGRLLRFDAMLFIE
jgi:hypothetical protein